MSEKFDSDKAEEYFARAIEAEGLLDLVREQREHLTKNYAEAVVALMQIEEAQVFYGEGNFENMSGDTAFLSKYRESAKLAAKVLRKAQKKGKYFP